LGQEYLVTYCPPHLIEVMMTFLMKRVMTMPAFYLEIVCLSLVHIGPPLWLLE
jgi:hypothetical protein